MLVRLSLLIPCVAVILLATVIKAEAQEVPLDPYVVQPGDTWSALAWRFGVDLLAGFPGLVHPNTQRQPAIGSSLPIGTANSDYPGRLFRTGHGGLLQLAAGNAVSPWLIAMRNERHHPFLPLLHGAIVVPVGTEAPRELPAGFTSLELKSLVNVPGRAVAFRGRAMGIVAIKASLNDSPMATYLGPDTVLGLGATGAFFGSGEPELAIVVNGSLMWVQPWRFTDISWEYQQLTLSGEAAAIDQTSIAEERARLSDIWSATTPVQYWNRPFQLPIADYIAVSSSYGARRSYNGGPYRTYHEGLDFSAYGGTEVFASAAAQVVLAEELVVRGGAVILDHGLGVFTGYYHLSEINVGVGEFVSPGQLLGLVGTTGLSTGNHLHWDFLVNGIWVDGSAWINQDIACWILEGLDSQCDQ